MAFAAFPLLADDPVGEVYESLARDPRLDKLDLGIGVYRDVTGGSPLMSCIQAVQQRLGSSQPTKSYISPSGNQVYCHLVERLIFGPEHPALIDHRILTVQTPGAGGALRVGAELIKIMSPGARLWLSDPTWDHQRLIMECSGLPLADYPYYDTGRNLLLFDRMLSALDKANPGDVVLLHGCCHNPTGEDLSIAQWAELGEFMRHRRLIPFVDLVYQGLGDGIEEDVAGVRHLAAMMPEMILASSSSKSFGVYRDRTGGLSLIFDGSRDVQANAARHVSRVTRSLYFMPPDWGASLVAEVLGDPDLERAWRAELSAIRDRIQLLRRSFGEALADAIPAREFGFIARQKGMFSLLPLSSAMLKELSTSRGIYLMPDGRMNVAALTEKSIPRVVDAIAQVLGDRPGARDPGSHQGALASPL